MHKKMEAFARNEIKAGLATCTDGQQSLFKRVYSHKDPDKDIGLIVDAIPVDNISNALGLVERTLTRNRQPQSAGDSAPGFSIDKQFTCPKCGSHYFGTVGGGDDWAKAVSHCHGYVEHDDGSYPTCKFSWPRSEDAKYFGPRSQSVGDSGNG